MKEYRFAYWIGDHAGDITVAANDRHEARRLVEKALTSECANTLSYMGEVKENTK